MGWLRTHYLLHRFRRGRRAGRSVRLRVADVGRFFRDLDAAGVAYVVMHWLHEVPLTPQETAAFEGHVDVLVQDHDERAIAWAAGRQPGSVAIELRSVSGRLGSYGGLAYVPPTFALDVLASRVRHARGFWAPSPDLQLPLLFFHLCYHAAEDTGIPTGVDLPTGVAPRDYAARTERAAADLGRALPRPLTLEAMRRELAALDRDMRLDLLLRWPRESAWIRGLVRAERRRHREAARRLPGFGVFVTRADLPPDWTPALLDLLGSEFDVLEYHELDAAARARVARHVRGGNWTTRRGYPDAGPTAYVLVRARATGSEDAVAVKRRLRVELRDRCRAAGVRLRHGLHGSDGPLEAVYMLRTIRGDDAGEEIDRLARLCLRDGDVDQRLAAVDERVAGQPDHDPV